MFPFFFLLLLSIAVWLLTRFRDSSRVLSTTVDVFLDRFFRGYSTRTRHQYGATTTTAVHYSSFVCPFPAQSTAIDTGIADRLQRYQHARKIPDSSVINFVSQSPQAIVTVGNVYGDTRSNCLVWYNCPVQKINYDKAIFHVCYILYTVGL